MTVAGRTLFTDLGGVTELLVSERRSVMVTPLSGAARSGTGAASLGVLMTVFDSGASGPALIAVSPDWTATQDMSLHGAAPIRTGPIVVDSRLVRVGKKVVIVSADLYDGCGVDDPAELVRMIDGPDVPPLAGRGLLAFARLPRSAATGIEDYDPSRWVGAVRSFDAVDPAPEPLAELLGLRVLDRAGGLIELERTPYVTNSIGTILGGVQAIMIEASAEAVCPDAVATDMQVHFLSQLRVGPARAAATVLREGADHCVVSVRLTDAGNDDHILALGTVTLTR
jgi:acyl-coenzyme A thioesterase PaaI-like protein